MKFASRVYTIAGIIGLIEMVPLFFMESLVGEMSPPAITHPEYYYAFVSVTLVWQILFLMMARDPLRYRPLMVPTILEKCAYVIPTLILVALERVPTSLLPFVVGDGVLGVLFVLAYVRTAEDVTSALRHSSF